MSYLSKNIVAILFPILLSSAANAAYEIRLPSGAASEPTYTISSYDPWGSCQSDSTQVRTATCTRDTDNQVMAVSFCSDAVLSQSCTYIACNGAGLQNHIAEYAIAGSFTFVAPSEISAVKLTVIGGGAGGRTATGDAGVSGGGSGAVIWRRSMTLTPGENVAMVIGSKGLGNGLNAVSGVNFATNGTLTSFGSIVVANGRANTSSWMGVGGALPSGANAYAGVNTPPAGNFSWTAYDHAFPQSRIFNSATPIFSSDFNVAGVGGMGARNMGGNGYDGAVGIEWYGCAVGL